MIRVTVPATSANLGPGFDCIGMALDISNIIEVEEYGAGGLHIELLEGENSSIPMDDSNLIYRSMLSLFDTVGYRPKGIRIRQINNIPMAMGLGSSAACIAGGIVAANHIAGNPLTFQELIDLSSNLDGHPDNVLPALVGGIAVGCIQDKRVYYSKINAPKDMCLALITPKYKLLTVKARSVLPEKISLEDSVFNVSRASLLVASLLNGNIDNLSIAMDDRMHQPYRKGLIPGFDFIREKAIECGGKGSFLSGAGPIIIAMVHHKDKCTFEAKMQRWLLELEDSWTLRWANINDEGIKTTIY
ncbi:MAG: homoserine kinase [Clostridiales bacterium]|nr:homoserine kinase [Clostridiales bacterium]